VGAIIVELDDMPGIRLVGHLSGIRELRIGMPMRAVFERLDDDAVLPQWEPVVESTADP
jgi:uncharacterized OB-fold protein